MKFRIKEKPQFDNWSGKWETHYAVERQFLYLFWINIVTLPTLAYADITLKKKSEKYLENKTFNKSRKVIKEIEV